MTLKRTGPPKRRRGIRPVSAKALALVDEHRVVRERVFRRDQWRCQLLALDARHRCTGAPLTPHHLQKSWKGGPYEDHNLVTLCAGGNTWVEDHPDEAWPLGLVVREGESIDEAWARMARARR